MVLLHGFRQPRNKDDFGFALADGVVCDVVRKEFVPLWLPLRCPLPKYPWASLSDLIQFLQQHQYCVYIHPEMQNMLELQEVLT